MAFQVQVKRTADSEWVGTPPDRFWQEKPIRFWTDAQATGFMERALGEFAGKRVVEVDDGPGDAWTRGEVW